MNRSSPRSTPEQTRFGQDGPQRNRFEEGTRAGGAQLAGDDDDEAEVADSVDGDADQVQEPVPRQVRGILRRGPVRTVGCRAVRVDLDLRCGAAACRTRCRSWMLVHWRDPAHGSCRPSAFARSRSLSLNAACSRERDASESSGFDCVFHRRSVVVGCSGKPRKRCTRSSWPRCLRADRSRTAPTSGSPGCGAPIASAVRRIARGRRSCDAGARSAVRVAGPACPRRRRGVPPQRRARPRTRAVRIPARPHGDSATTPCRLDP